MESKVFLDTAYAVALSSIRDQYHNHALRLANQLESGGTKMITTRAVVLEIGNALSRQRYREAAVKLLVSLEIDPNITVVPLSERLYRRAFQLFRERADKDWGIIDCISFIVMQDNDIVEALTSDEHFRQAGFRSLLLERS
jgi:hypothetical protein